jgi:beta-phosphoglucomutase
MKFKAVIFDFNGTLYWDTAYHNLSLTDEEKAYKIHGKSNDDILKGIFNRSLSPEELQKMSNEKELIYHNIALNEKIEFAPGALDFFQYLKSKNIEYTIATSSTWINIEFYLKYMDLANWIDPKKIIFENGSFRSKPNSDIFILAMEKLHVGPKEVIIFEDSPTGIMAAENAGAGKIIVVNSTRRDYSDLPYTIICHFDEVDRDLF